MVGFSEDQTPVLTKLVSRKFFAMLLPAIGGLIGIDSKILWGVIAVAAFYIAGNVIQKFVICRKEIILAQLAQKAQ